MGKGGIGVGSASIVLVFAVLCLTIFSLITFVVAGNDKALVEAKAEMVTGYYKADALAEQIFVDLLALDSMPEVKHGVEIHTGWDEELGIETTYFYSPISEDKALFVNFTVNNDGTYYILSWRMHDMYEWQYDGSINIWAGG